MKTVVIATEKPFAAEAREVMVAQLEEAGFEVKLLEKYEGVDALKAGIAEAHGLIVRSDLITADVMEAAPELALVVRAGSGFDNIDTAYAQAHGIVVENTPGQNANAVAELAFELALAALRPLNGKAGRELKGRRLAVHGFGNIGRIVARLGRAFGMQVRAFDMTLDAAVAREMGVTAVDSVEALYAGAHVVSLHIPDNPATHGSITEALLLTMAEDAILVNTARAGVIDEAGLRRVLDARPAFSYVSDVSPSSDTVAWAAEHAAERLVVTPKKQGAQTLEANLNAGAAAARQTVAYFKRGDTTFCVYKVIPAHLEAYTSLATQLGRLNAAFVASPREVRLVAYGELREHAGTLAEYVLKGVLTCALGETCTPNEAARHAADHGMRVAMVDPDNARGYGNALTVDFVSADGVEHSSRGRIDEGQMEASRIGEFKARMPLDPGLYVIAAYKEGPGMADTVGHLLTDAGYNRVILGAGPNMDNTKAQAFFEVEKRTLSYAEQVEEVTSICEHMRQAPDVHDVKVIDLR